tara:strand:- start:63 stop:299 length:237 start_codon:yes stop_codon:yes gene_type:complete
MYKIINKETGKKIVLNTIETATFLQRNNADKYKVLQLKTKHDKIFDIIMYVLSFAILTALLFIGCYCANIINELTLIK